MDANADGKKLDEETIAEWRRKEAELGRKFSYEFVDMLQGTAYEAVREWLKANNCPELVVNTLDNANMLMIFANRVENKSLSDIDAEWLLDMVPEVTEQIMLIGGTFTAPGGSMGPRENIVTWQPKSEPDQPGAIQ